MRNIFLFCVAMFLMACQSPPITKDNKYSGPLPRFSYKDGIVTARKINCASNEPKSCMACALQGEAANQTAKGMYAVGITIMTRAKGNPKRVCRVTKSRRQFEGMRRRGYRKISKKVWEVTQYVLEKKETGWTHFFAPKQQAKLRRSKPTWAYEFEARQCFHKKIDDHIFYNNNKCVRKPLRRNASTK